VRAPVTTDTGAVRRDLLHRLLLVRDAAEITDYLAAHRVGGAFGIMSSPLVTHWYFHLPNFILAALMYTLLGRVLLGLIVDPNSQNYIWRFFCRFTDPVVRAVEVVTPKAAAPVILWLFAFVWLFWIRVVFYALFATLGSAPRL
jgi:YggT family protein